MGSHPWKRSPLEKVGSIPTTAPKKYKKSLDILPGLWYYNTRKRKNPTNRKENLKMTFEYYEIHATEWEAAQAFWAEEEDLVQMDADWEASGGHLWD